MTELYKKYCKNGDVISLSGLFNKKNTTWVEYICGNKKYDINYIDSDNKSILMYAVKYNNYKIIKTLINFGANVNYNYNQNYILTESIKHGTFYVQQLLINSGANVNININGFSLLWDCIDKYANIELIKLLLSTGSNVNYIHECKYEKCCVYNKYSILAYSLVKNDINIVKLLLKYGANIYYEPKVFQEYPNVYDYPHDEEVYMPINMLGLAIYYCNFDIIKLFKGLPLNNYLAEYKIIEHMVDDPRVLELFINKIDINKKNTVSIEGDNISDSTFMSCLEYSKKEILKYLIQNGADCDDTETLIYDDNCYLTMFMGFKNTELLKLFLDNVDVLAHVNNILYDTSQLEECATFGKFNKFNIEDVKLLLSYFTIEDYKQKYDNIKYETHINNLEIVKIIEDFGFEIYVNLNNGPLFQFNISDEKLEYILSHNNNLTFEEITSDVSEFKYFTISKLDLFKTYGFDLYNIIAKYHIINKNYEKRELLFHCISHGDINYEIHPNITIIHSLILSYNPEWDSFIILLNTLGAKIIVGTKTKTKNNTKYNCKLSQIDVFEYILKHKYHAKFNTLLCSLGFYYNPIDYIGNNLLYNEYKSSDLISLLKIAMKKFDYEKWLITDSLISHTFNFDVKNLCIDNIKKYKEIITLIDNIKKYKEIITLIDDIKK